MSSDNGSTWGANLGPGVSQNTWLSTVVITVPAGTNRMRVAVNVNNTSGPCVFTNVGESEDYRICSGPATPTANAASAIACTSFSANWSASTGATKYYLDVSTVSNFASFVAGYNNLDVGNVTTKSVTGLAAGTNYYYRVRANNTCLTSGNSNVIGPVTTLTNSTAPTGASATVNPTCGGATVLSATGGSLGSGASWKWYTGSCGGTLVGSGSPSVSPASTTAYYVRAEGTCNTTACPGAYTVTVNSVPALVTVSGGGTFCGSTALTASGGAGGTIYWQNTTSGGTSTADATNPKTVSSSGTYYFRAYNSCGWGTEGNAAVTINAIPSAPTGSSGQSFCGTGTVSGLSATGTAIQWYSASSGGSPLSGGTALVNGNHYYASQTVNGCESTSRFDVTATINTPATTSLSANDYVWNSTSANWDASVNNWLQYNGSSFVIPGAIPSSSSTNIFLRAFSGCASAATVNASINCNNLTIESGMTLTISGTNTLSVYGNFSNSGTFNPGSGTVSFSGSTNQAINGSAFNNITFNNNTSGSNDINISQPVSVAGAGTFTNGIVYFTGTGSLTFGSGASSNGGSASSFVNGPVTKTGSDAFTFPVGKVSGSEIWAPVGIAAPASPSVISAEYFHSSPGNVFTLCDPSTYGVSSIEYWDLSSNAAYPAVTLHWKDAARSEINTSFTSEITVAHWEDCGGTPKWDYKNPTTGGSGGTSGSVTSETALTSYSPFAFGTKTKNNPLPIELLSFEARCNNGRIYVEWSTASEINNSFFTVEKATNEKKEPNQMIFEPIGKIKSKGNSSTLQSYSFVDLVPTSKENNWDGINYYRLKQTDLNGVHSYSGTIYTSCNNPVFENIIVYPNPASGELNCDILSKENILASIRITDVLGRNLVIEKVNLSIGENHITIDVSKLSPAPYYFKLEAMDGDIKDCKQILVK